MGSPLRHITVHSCIITYRNTAFMMILPFESMHITMCLRPAYGTGIIALGCGIPGIGKPDKAFLIKIRPAAQLNILPAGIPAIDQFPAMRVAHKLRPAQDSGAAKGVVFIRDTGYDRKALSKDQHALVCEGPYPICVLNPREPERIGYAHSGAEAIEPCYMACQVFFNGLAHSCQTGCLKTYPCLKLGEHRREIGKQAFHFLTA